MGRVSTDRSSVDIGSNQLCTVIGNWPCCRSSTERAGVEVSKDNRVNTPLFLLPRVGKLPLHRDYGGLSRVGVLRKYARAEEAIRLQIGLGDSRQHTGQPLAGRCNLGNLPSSVVILRFVLGLTASGPLGRTFRGTQLNRSGTIRALGKHGEK